MKIFEIDAIGLLSRGWGVSFVFGVPLAKAKKLFMAQAFHVPIGKGGLSALERVGSGSAIPSSQVFERARLDVLKL